MKIIKKLFCLFISVSIVCSSIHFETKAWSRNNHEHIVTIVFTEKISSVQASKQELNLLYKSCRLPDDLKIYPGNFHGRENYVVIAKYLYELSLTYLNTKSKVINDKNFIDNYYKSCSYIPNSEEKNIQQINKSLAKLLSTKIKYKNNYEMSNRNKSIKIMGFECHEIGDIFAHMTIVPKNCINGKNNQMKFHRSDFSNVSQWKTFQKIILNYEISYGDLKSLWTLTAKNRNTNEYVKLSDIYGEKKLKSISKQLPAYQFEDNTTFNSNGYKAALKVTTKILCKYNKALKQVKKHKLDYNNIKFPQSSLIYYKRNSIYKLYNFDEYMSTIN